uniref:Uncharacterized protein n=1 Tax=Branchiostoma floridae TaxID=7739 RepID=C3Y2Y9_BRAFL|eukprot:XP_002609391.1 hypothetical protein BRAFLDRAFT_124615 [Branchiostoma floridae]
MATVAERAVGAIVGAAVADAAAQPLHWIYNLPKLDSIIAEEESPEFRQPSANPYYRIETGRNSCYGDQAYVILESLAECQGLDIADLKQRTYRMFGPGTDYDNTRNSEYRPHGGVKKSYPIHGSWRHFSIKDFLKNTEAGKDDTGSKEDDQVDGATKVAPLVALILEHFILHGKNDRVIETVMEDLRKPDRKSPTDLDQAMVSFLQKVLDNRDDLPKSLQSAVHGVVTGGDYVSAIRTTIRAGGCNASRSSIIGACFGAQVGVEGIPADWKAKTFRYQRVLELASRVVSCRSSLL